MNVRKELENKFKGIKNNIIDDAINYAEKNYKNENLSLLTSAKRYIERYIASEIKKDNIDIEICTIDIFHTVKLLLMKLDGVNSSNVNMLYEKAISNIFDGYDKEKDFSINIVTKVKEILKGKDVSKESNVKIANIVKEKINEHETISVKDKNDNHKNNSDDKSNKVSNGKLKRDKYKNITFTDYSFLNEYMTIYGISREKLAKLIDIDINKFNEVINGISVKENVYIKIFNYFKVDNYTSLKEKIEKDIAIFIKIKEKRLN